MHQATARTEFDKLVVSTKEATRITASDQRKLWYRANEAGVDLGAVRDLLLNLGVEEKDLVTELKRPRSQQSPSSQGSTTGFSPPGILSSV